MEIYRKSETTLRNTPLTLGLPCLFTPIHRHLYPITITNPKKNSQIASNFVLLYITWKNDYVWLKKQHNSIKYTNILKMVDLSIRDIGGESQIFRKNLKFQFQCIKLKILWRLQPISVRTVLIVIFNDLIRKKYT